MESSNQHANSATGSNLYKFLLSLVAAFALTWLIKEPAFTKIQTYVLFLLILSVGLWLTEAVPSFAVGFLIVTFLMYTFADTEIAGESVDITVFTNTFSSSVIWLMLGGFFLASALTKTRLDADLIQLTLKVCGKDPKWILFSLMIVSMVASMLISNTATTAMVVAAIMPLLNKLGRNANSSKAFILGVPLAASTGGMGTIIGSPPNAIAAGLLTTADKPVEFVTWMYYGVPVTIVLTLIAWLVLRKMFLKHAGLIDVSPSATDDTGKNKEASVLQRWIVIVVFFMTLLLWLSSPLHGLSTAAVSAIPLVLLPLTGVLNSDDMRTISWDTLILVGGGLSLGAGLQQTGLLELYADRIAHLQVPDIMFLFILAYATMLFSNIMSNTATSTVLIPLGMAILPASQTEVAMIIGLSASTALFLPVSTPPNAIAYSTGLIRQKDFRIGGTLIGVIGPALIVLWVILVSKLQS